jgi:hypothetical protein
LASKTQGKVRGHAAQSARRTQGDEHRSLATFTNALRATLGLDPLVPEGDEGGRVFHQAWPWSSGNSQVGAAKTDFGERRQR